MPNDFREALRGLRIGKGTTALAFALLSVAMGATTVTFSVVDAVALRPLPYADPGRLISLSWQTPGPPGSISAPTQDFFAWRQRVRSLEQIGAYRAWRPIRTDAPSGIVVLQEGQVTANLFEVLGVRAALGRVFVRADEEAGPSQAAVLTHSAWARHFGRDPAVVGRVVRMGDGTRTVVGVLPEEITFPITTDRPPDVFVVDPRLAATHSYSPDDFVFPVDVVGRLRRGANLSQVRQEVEQVSAAVRGGALPPAERPVALSLHDRTVGPAKSWLLLVLVAVSLVLLVACVNVASLLLARATTRERELAVRQALGASPARLARVMLLEGLTLSSAAAAAGIAIAYAGVAVAKQELPPDLARTSAIAIDLRVLGISAAAALACGLAFAGLPALVAARRNLLGFLQTSGASVVGTRRQTRALRRFLVAEVAFVSVLLVTASLAITSFVLVSTADLGFDRRSVATFGWSRNLQDVPEAARGAAAAVLRRDLTDRASAVPGVIAAGLTTSSAPLSGGMSRAALTISGHGPVSADVFEVNAVTPGYFAAIGLQLRRGRLIDGTDTVASPRVALINEAAAAQFFSGRDPIGQTVTIETPATIVGVLQSVRLTGPEGDVRPELYLALEQTAGGARGQRGTLVVRTAGQVADVARSVGVAIGPVLGGASPPPQFTEDSFARLTSARRFNAGLMGMFGFLALAIGAVGVYGTMAFFVSQHALPLAIRVAIGASRSQILHLILREALWGVSGGLAIGLLASWAVSRALASLVFGITATDPRTYATVAFVVITGGALAAFLPAWRAARIDPLTALKND